MYCSEADDCRRILETGALGSHLNGYGGGSLAALDDRVVVVSDKQRLISVNPDDAVATVLVDERECEWGGLAADPARNRVLAVREASGAQQLVAVGDNGDWQCLHEGEDFYGAPALSPDGWRIAGSVGSYPTCPGIRANFGLGSLIGRETCATCGAAFRPRKAPSSSHCLAETPFGCCLIMPAGGSLAGSGPGA